MPRLSLIPFLAALFILPRAWGEDAPHALSQSEREPRIAEVRAELARMVAGLDRQLARPSPTPSVRDLPNAALAKLILGQDPAQAEAILRRLVATQDNDPKSPRFGSVPWQIGHPEIVDDNAIDFSTQSIGPLLLLYGDKLSPQFKEQELIPYVRASFSALQRRNLKVSYTNIWLMRTECMVLMGEAVKDANAADEGYRELDQWIDYTRQNGVHEFDSPTYYSVDLSSASLGYLLCARPEGKAKFKAALDYLWTDIAANYFPARGCLAGPHSRNYSFVNSWAGLDVNLYQEGFRSHQKLEKLDFEKVTIPINGAEKGYHPPQSLYDLANAPERIVQSRWDTDPQHDRYNYLTRDFVIGSAQGAYGPQDKMISVELASEKTGKPLPVMAVIPDMIDSPYGKLKTLDRSGHSKPTHLPPNITAVQEKGVLLAMLDLDPTHEKKEIASLATNFLLPAAADQIVLDGKRISLGVPIEIAAKVDSIVGVREGQAGVVLRFFQIDGCDGQSPAFAVKSDEIGLQDGAARLVAYHYQGPAKMLAETHVRAGMIIIAAPCRSDEEFAALQAEAKNAVIEQRADGKTWDVTARIGGSLSLSASHDLQHHKTLWRKVNGKEVESQLLMINGQDMAAKIWGTLPR